MLAFKEKQEKQYDLLNSIRNDIPAYAAFYLPYSSETIRDPYRIFLDFSGSENYPDFSEQDAIDALRSRHIKVYSNSSIENGTLVSPSRSFMEDFGTHIESKIVSIEDIAWMDVFLGHFAKV